MILFKLHRREQGTCGEETEASFSLHQHSVQLRPAKVAWEWKEPGREAGHHPTTENTASVSLHNVNVFS